MSLLQTDDRNGSRYSAFFHELDAWTEYWDIYHPETCGRYYFGDGREGPGLLTRLLPREGRPEIFTAWTRLAVDKSALAPFSVAARKA